MTRHRLWLKKYLTGIIAFLTGLYALVCWHNRHYPPTITNSISFDSKIRFMRDHFQRVSNARTIAIGSSICLNNIDTDYLELNLKDQAPFLNAAAWGLQVSQARQLLHFLLHNNGSVKRVLYVTQLVDFRQDVNERIFDFDDVGAYIRHQDGLFFPIKYFNANTMYKNIKSGAKNANPHDYGCLAFQPTGSALLDVRGANRKPDRWNNYGRESVISPNSYKELGDFCREIRSRNIEFFCVLTPLRGHFHETGESGQVQLQFKRRVSQIIQEAGGTYIDADTALNLNDDDFADTMHLNGSGATKVAQYLLPLIDKGF